ncbi:MAG: lamin tail domain-containing protein [Bacteroidetes bacterium]|nr:lamin tail domain-containing protein [Bacteroidota bacterium]
MKKILLLVLAISAYVFSYAQCNDLFISEYVEGSHTNKALEIYNPTDKSISLDSYQMSRYSNGNTTPNFVSFPIGASILAHGTYVVVLDKRDPLGTGQDTSVFENLQFRADAFLCPVYEDNKMMYFNGNDAVTLEKNAGDIIDIIGKVGQNPGISWTDDTTANFIDTGDWTRYWTKDQTLIRKSSIAQGVTVNPTFFNPVVEWDSLPRNTFTSLGWHVCDCYTDPDQPVFNQTSYEFNVYQNAENGTSVGTITAIDGTSDVLSYYFESGNYVYLTEGDIDIRHTPFEIERSTGAIKVRDNKGLDYNVLQSFNIIAQVTDGSTPVTCVVKINLTKPQSVSENINNPTFEVYPNPTFNNNITIKSFRGISSIKVFNIIGKIVYSNFYNDCRNSINANFENINKGMYFVSITDINDNVVTKKILIK